MEDKNDTNERRGVSATAARYLTAINAAVSAVALTLLVTFFLNLPKELSALREQYAGDMAGVRAELRALSHSNDDVAESVRGLLPIRDKILLIEKQVDRHEGQINRIDSRLDAMEERRPGGLGFGEARKK